jgi:hypothetical protein
MLPVVFYTVIVLCVTATTFVGIYSSVAGTEIMVFPVYFLSSESLLSLVIQGCFRLHPCACLLAFFGEYGRAHFPNANVPNRDTSTKAAPSESVQFSTASEPCYDLLLVDALPSTNLWSSLATVPSLLILVNRCLLSAALGIHCRIFQILLYAIVHFYSQYLFETEEKMDTPWSSARGNLVYVEFHNQDKISKTVSPGVSPGQCTACEMQRGDPKILECA